MTDWDRLAQEKLGRVLGDNPARELLADGMRSLGINQLKSAQDLYRFAQVLRAGNPIVAACGASLGLTAVMRGAVGEK